MFTGLIEEIGTIKAIKHMGSNRRITVEANIIINDLRIDHSVALNGVCQTVVSRTEKTFDVEAVEETLRKTTLNKFTAGKKINLERALRLGDRLGGHLVQGHVDCTGRIISIHQETAGKLVWLGFPQEFSKYIVPVGSVCIDGVSLTAARVKDTKFMVSIIPYTWEMTMFNEYRTGTEVNLEFDIIGKYVDKISASYFGGKTSTVSSSILEQFLSQ